MGVQLADAELSINNDTIAYSPNTLKYTEGRGEQNIRAASGGGGQVEQIYSNDIESNFSDISVEIPATVRNIDLALQWKENQNQNVITIVGSTPEGSLTRTFTQAALLSNYQVELGTETNISLEFKANQAV